MHAHSALAKEMASLMVKREVRVTEKFDLVLILLSRICLLSLFLSVKSKGRKNYVVLFPLLLYLHVFGN